MNNVNDMQSPQPPKFDGMSLPDMNGPQANNNQMPIMNANQASTGQNLDFGLKSVPSLDLTDSFGEKVNPGDSLNEPKKQQEPKFKDGVLINQAPMMKKEEKMPIFEVKKNKAGKVGNKKEDGFPPIVLLIVHLVAVTVIGVGVFFLWKYQHDQIQVLKTTISGNNSKITDLNNKLNNTQDEIKISADLPVFVADNSRYSFYQNVPGLTVNAVADQVMIAYGEVNGQTPTNGFVLELKNEDAAGTGLAQIVDKDFDLKEDGVEKLDKRTEMIADNMGFSFVKLAGGEEKIIYYLQKEVNASHYIVASYVIAGTEADYSNYEKIVTDLLKSLKLY